MSSVRAERPVAVVGGGPVGMTAAATLARAGLPVVLVEQNDEPRPDWRASTFHAATLEVLETIDITAQMHAEGLVVPTYQFRDRRDGLIAEFDFRLLADATRFPYRLQLNQQHLVRMLHERLQGDPNVRLRLGTRLTDLRIEPSGPVLALEGPDGACELAASYVIGADGPRSTVRGALGVAFDGYTYPERFAITSTPVDLQGILPGLGHVNYVADPEQWLFILRTPESWRVVWPVPEGVSDEDATSPERLQRLLQGIAPYAPGYPVIDHQVYGVHQRVAATFRAGPVLLAGDAAHINSPIGGVGLNSGIHDAMDAARRLTRIIRDGAEQEPELDAYDRVRRTVAVEYVQADTQRNTDRLRERDEAVRRRHQDDMRAIAADPDKARAYIRRVSLLESVERFGIGRPPEELDLEGVG
ncbi:3-(3-hydroxy-phenyl)propionate hydroxylase [Pseudonocardia hierapolitana]|uniref:3-(3-hydroxy-phenyl)propionate hydroxylase n=1 Tax=Pseudonocardia hierapolitana TaxID=1128676 RepID=A0A561SWP0_9PSEU|nr:NAD(P)/FAD-dependent oxidoreductase [Pseudonocardia hierapolitana]TWF79278.1 3-(3-hydroxy-phenyl)propionate hydroxylase [Pseudonocardia hierapolitana]